MPKLPVDPGDPGDKAVGLYGAKNGPGVGIDLMDLPIPVLPDPQTAFSPRQTGVTSAAGCRNRTEHLTASGIDLLDALLCDLKKVLAIECCSCMRGDIN